MKPWNVILLSTILAATIFLSITTLAPRCPSSVKSMTAGNLLSAGCRSAGYRPRYDYDNPLQIPQNP
jgi:hypothetical protein